MKGVRVVTCLSVIFCLVMALFLYVDANTNVNLLTSIDRVYSINNKSSKYKDLKNEIGKVTYKHLITYNIKKEDASKYSYIAYQNEMVNSNIYKDLTNFINKTKDYRQKEYKAYKELNNSLQGEGFIRRLKDENKYSELLTHINQNIVLNVINEKDISNIIDSDREKYNDLLKYLDYLESNKDRWYYVNRIIVCKDEEILNKIENKNKELDLDIKIILEGEEEAVKKIPVLMYHGVSDETWGIANLFMKVKDFEEQLKYIHDNYESIFVEEIDRVGSKKVVVLTFDDGYVDFYTNVFPLLKKYNMKANLYVIDNADGGVYLSKSQIKEIADSNLVSIGSHTETHVNLANLDSVQLEYELKESKNNIEKLIGKEVKTICYPLGAYNDKVLEAASKYYDYGLIIENGVQKMYDDYNKLAIRRFRVYRNTGFSSFKNMVDQAN